MLNDDAETCRNPGQMRLKKKPRKEGDGEEEKAEGIRQRKNMPPLFRKVGHLTGNKGQEAVRVEKCKQ